MNAIKVVKKLQKIGKFDTIVIQDNEIQVGQPQGLNAYDLKKIYKVFRKKYNISLIASGDDILLNITKNKQQNYEQY